MKSNKTKKALLSSLLVLLLCFAMLLGSTFAWFTDSASTNVNTIQAGTLKIDLVDADNNSLVGETLKWQKAEGHENEDVLWEPGAEYKLQPVKIVNKGNLALKYDVKITGMTGDTELNDVLEWTISDSNENNVLLAGEEATLTISAKMLTSADNKYQGLKIENISITVNATQTPYEWDSTTNQYDADVEYAITAHTPTEFEGIISIDNNEYTMTENVNYVNTDSEHQLFINCDDEIVFDGNGNTITIIGADPSADNHGYLSFYTKNATISDLTVTGTGFVELGDYGLQGGTYTVNNLVLENMVSTLESPDKGFTLGCTFMHYGTATLNDCVMTGATALINGVTPVDIGFGNGTTSTVNGGEYGVAYCWSHSVVTINGAEIGTLYVSPIGGSVTIKAGTHIETLNIDYGTSTATEARLAKLVIEDGATVDSIIFEGNTYTLAQWKAR